MKLPVHYSKITQPERRLVREEYVELQNGLCYYCGKELSERPVMEKTINWSLFPGGRKFLNHPVHLHHDHDTDLTLGAVHSYCNAVLWQYHGE